MFPAIFFIILSFLSGWQLNHYYQGSADVSKQATTTAEHYCNIGVTDNRVIYVIDQKGNTVLFNCKERGDDRP